jgi:hypothetical protein
MLKNLIANFYELWGATFLGEFSDQMFSNNLYMSIAMSSVIVAFVITILYYYVIDRPGTAKLGVWFIALLLGAIASVLIAFVSANNGLTDVYASIGADIPPGFSSDMFLFSLVNAMWVVLLMIFLSFIFKWKSTNSSYIPF